MNEVIEKITNANVKDIIVNAYPELLFQVIDLLKDLCEQTKSDYNIFLGLFGLIGDDVKLESQSDTVNLDKEINTLFIKIAAFFYQEYDKKTKQPGKRYLTLIDLLSDATDINKDVLRKTDYRVLLNILNQFIQQPSVEANKSFL